MSHFLTLFTFSIGLLYIMFHKETLIGTPLEVILRAGNFMEIFFEKNWDFLTTFGDFSSKPSGNTGSS